MKQTASTDFLLFGLFFDPEDGGDKFLRNVGWLSCNYKALYFRDTPLQVIKYWQFSGTSTYICRFSTSDFNRAGTICNISLSTMVGHVFPALQGNAFSGTLKVSGIESKHTTHGQTWDFSQVCWYTLLVFRYTYQRILTEKTLDLPNIINKAM
jgi:hypothetical protein